MSKIDTFWNQISKSFDNSLKYPRFRHIFNMYHDEKVLTQWQLISKIKYTWITVASWLMNNFWVIWVRDWVTVFFLEVILNDRLLYLNVPELLEIENSRQTNVFGSKIDQMSQGHPKENVWKNNWFSEL